MAGAPDSRRGIPALRRRDEVEPVRRNGRRYRRWDETRRGRMGIGTRCTHASTLGPPEAPAILAKKFAIADACPTEARSGAKTSTVNLPRTTAARQGAHLLTWSGRSPRVPVPWLPHRLAKYATIRGPSAREAPSGQPSRRRWARKGNNLQRRERPTSGHALATIAINGGAGPRCGR